MNLKTTLILIGVLLFAVAALLLTPLVCNTAEFAFAGRLSMEAVGLGLAPQA